MGGGLRPRAVRGHRGDRQLRGLKLARHLKDAGIAVVEVERPKRRHLRRRGKSDPIATRRPPPERCWPAKRPESPKAATVGRR